MKRFLRLQLIILFVSALGVTSWGQCDYQLRMIDSFGDGWNGNTIDVIVNGTPVLDNVTLASGSEEFLSFSVSTSDQITTLWNGGGSFGYETSYEILDFSGAVVGSGSESSITVPIAAACPACGIPGNVATANETATTVDINWDAVATAVNGYNWEVVPAGNGQGVGVVSSGSTTNTMVTATGLSSGTSYDVYVNSDCGAGGTSPYSLVVNFTTTFDYCNGDLFVDSGGTTGDYDNSENITTVICPDNAGDVVSVNFTEFSSENNGTTGCWDGLTIYNGDSNASPVIPAPNANIWCWDRDDATPTGTGDLQGMTITSTDASGCLTFVFTSDGSATREGFQAMVTCEAPPACNDPSGLSVSSVTNNSASVSWTANSGETDWEVAVQAAGTGVPAGAGTATTNNPYSATGLASNTEYEVYVRADCGGGDLSEWVGPVNFRTLPANPQGVTCTSPGANSTVVFTEEIDAQGDWTGDFGGANGQWTIDGGNGTASGVTTTGPTGAHSGTDYMYYEASGNATATASAVSPAIDLTGYVDDAELSFWMHAHGAGMGTLEVGIGTSAAGPFTNEFTWSGPLQTAQGDAWYNIGIDLTAYLNQTIYIEFSHTGAANFNGDMAIDLLEVTTCASCGPPSTVASSAVEATTATVTWTDGLGCTANATVTVSPAIAGSPFTVACGTGTIDLTGLTSNTEYTVTVANDCGTMPSASTTFTTLPDYCAGDIFTDTGGTTGDYGVNENTTTIICPDNAGDVVSVNFTEFSSENNGTTGCWDGLTIYNGDSNASPVIPAPNANIWCWDRDDATPTGTGDLQGMTITSTDASGCLTFVFTSDGSVTREGFQAMVTCEAPPTCFTPSSLSSTNITDMTADLFWTANTGETAWEVAVQPQGTGVPAGAGTATTNNPYTATGLTGSTAYEYYVRADCGGGDLSDWAGPHNFMTLQTPPATAQGVTCTSPGASSTVLFSEEFNDNSAGWTGDINGGNGTWEIPDGATSTGTGADAAHSGANYMNYEASNTISNTGTIVTPAIDLSGAVDDAELSFWMHAYGTSMGTLNVGVGTDAAGPFTTEFTWTGQLQTSGADAWVNVGVDLSSYVGQTIYIALTQVDDQGGFEGDMSIDLFEVTTCTSCGPPSAGMASSITPSSATVSWTDGPGCTSDVTVTVTPAITGSPFTVACGTGTIDLTGLTSNTAYTVNIANDCGANPSTDVMFSTPLDYCAGDAFVDSGGAGGAYSNNENITTTMCPDNPGEVVAVTFTSFEMEGNGIGNCWDMLMIHNGADDTAPTIPSPGAGTDGWCFESLTDGSGDLTGATVISTDASGCLTFVSTTDGSATRAGYEATVTCGPAMLPPTNIPPSGTGLFTSDALVIDGNGWYHYYDDVFDYLMLSIQQGGSGAQIGLTGVTVQAGTGTTDLGTASATCAGGAPYTNVTEWETMNRTWDVAEQTQPSSAVNVISYYTTDDYNAVVAAVSDGSITAHQDMTFYKVNSPSEEDLTAAGNECHQMVAAADYVEYDDFTYAAYGTHHSAQIAVTSFSGGGGGGGAAAAGALPIELISFTGEAMNKYNQLTWISATEENTRMHYIERSADGINDFREIGNVPAAGFSSEEIRYTLDDNTPLILGYYRLKTVDLDGKVQFSKVISIQREGNIFDVVSAYPVPTTKELTVEYVTSQDEEVTYTLTDVTGKIMMQNIVEANKGLNKEVIDIAALSSGVYFLTVQNSTSRIIKNIVKN